jgi:hypothetical protein
MIDALLHEVHESRAKAPGATVGRKRVSATVCRRFSTVLPFSMFALNLFALYSSILLVNPQPKREMNCASVLCSVFLFDENELASRDFRGVRQAWRRVYC